MRALVLCFALAACAGPVPEATNEQIRDELAAPATSPADNIAAIGGQGLCDDAASAVRERTGDGPAVTYCAAPALPSTAP